MPSNDPIGDAARAREHDDRIVYGLARVMFQKMRSNAHKAHWSTVSQQWLLDRLIGEVRELSEAIDHGDPAAIASECADVGNFAAMIADNAGGLDL